MTRTGSLLLVVKGTAAQAAVSARAHGFEDATIEPNAGRDTETALRFPLTAPALRRAIAWYAAADGGSAPYPPGTLLWYIGHPRGDAA